jgi:creatinine amidohydrolase/Fe(II)-dependent formamide hydrolase-like protein
MRKVLIASLTAALFATGAMTPAISSAAAKPSSQLVEFEMMTWPEVKAALEAGKTTALIYTGGVEQRGPQNVNGGHNQMARATVKAIAEKLGNAIAMPVLTMTPNNANPEFPGTIGLTNELLEAVLERMTQQTIVNGFKNVVLMGDHGGGQGEGDKNVYRRVANKMNAEYSPKGIHVFYCDQVYTPANDAFEKEVAKLGIAPSMHAGVIDTSEMLYLDKDGTHVRKDKIKDAVGIPVSMDGKVQHTDDPKLKNGIVGDARKSSAKLGKRAFDLKVEYAVKQIQSFIPPKS